jgi:ferric iron reductase protein FhuF
MTGELDDLLARAEPALAGYLRDKLRLAVPPDGGAIACRELFTAERFDGALAPLMARYPGSDRRAVASLWSLYYFSTLVIVPIILWRRLGLVLPLALDELQLIVSPETGLPEAFLLPHRGSVIHGLTASEALGTMIEDHLRPAIAFISGHSRLSPRLLWCNTAGYIDWIARELDPGRDDAAGLELFGKYKLTDGTDNPLHGSIKRISTADGTMLSQRKVCCLRYMLPGIGGCGETCPLPQGRI